MATVVAAAKQIRYIYLPTLWNNRKNLQRYKWKKKKKLNSNPMSDQRKFTSMFGVTLIRSKSKSIRCAKWSRNEELTVHWTTRNVCGKWMNLFLGILPCFRKEKWTFACFFFYWRINTIQKRTHKTRWVHMPRTVCMHK